jgi:EmrB/QacA subfamily drug resistance transporter
VKPPSRVSPSTAAAVAYTTGVFMTAVDLQIVNVALPTLGRVFHSSIASVQWTVVGYVLSLAVLIPASGWIGDRIGTKRTWLAALAIFTIASALCGSAQSLDELIVARVLQGVGGGMLTPVGTAMLFRAFPPQRRAWITRMLVVPILVGPATAPILGGLFTQEASWRWVFFVNVPIRAVELLFSAVNLREHREARRGRFDVRGFVLGGGGLSLVLYAISEGSVRGWGSLPIVASGLLGLAALTAFVRLEYRAAEPMLNLRLLDDRLFRATNVANCLNFGGFLSVLYLTPIFLQDVQHRSPISSGTTTFLEAIGVLVASQSLGRLYPRLGPRRMAAGGGAVVFVLLLGFQLVNAGTSLWVVRAMIFVIGAANSACFLSLQAAMFTTISRAETGHASAIYNTARQVSLAICVALVSTIVASTSGPRLDAFHAAYLAVTVITGLGGVAALVLIRTSDAAASMVGGERPDRAPTTS